MAKTKKSNLQLPVDQFVSLLSHDEKIAIMKSIVKSTGTWVRFNGEEDSIDVESIKAGRTKNDTILITV